MLAVAFGPYLVFDLLFQETFTSRYALPLVVPIAYLARRGAAHAAVRQPASRSLSRSRCSTRHVGGTSVAAYCRAEGAGVPAARRHARAAAAAPEPPVLAMDRASSRSTFAGRSCGSGDAMPPFARTLPAPPQHEWLEAVKYWNGGGRAPVWFVVDPMRGEHRSRPARRAGAYRWPLPYPVLVGGARPNEMDWYRVDRPSGIVGEGWALTPEAAGVAEATGDGLAFAPIDGLGQRSRRRTAR